MEPEGIWINRFRIGGHAIKRYRERVTKDSDKSDYEISKDIYDAFRKIKKKPRNARGDRIYQLWFKGVRRPFYAAAINNKLKTLLDEHMIKPGQLESIVTAPLELNGHRLSKDEMSVSNGDNVRKSPLLTSREERGVNSTKYLLWAFKQRGIDEEDYPKHFRRARRYAKRI